ncbi:hypothetical protein ECEC1868_3334, partial [Escherichia coli EC1868]
FSYLIRVMLTIH